jgi:hypothetical protein
MRTLLERCTITISMKRVWVYIKETPTWTWLVLFLISAIFTTHALRQNNFQMVKLRDTVYAADKSGHNVDVALNNLRQYVYGHMNTNLSSGGNSIKPPIQLKYTYDRLVKAEQQRVNAANDKIYRDAQSYCEIHQPGKYRQVCFQQYTDKYNVKANVVPAALYQYDFISPTWSPDLAGWSLIAGIILGLAFIVSCICDLIANIRVKHRRRNKRQ